MNSAVGTMTKVGADIRLSAQRALLGNIPGSLRAFSVEVSDGVVRLRSIFDGSATNEHVEMLSAAGTEIISDYPEHLLEEDFRHLPDSSPMEHLAHIIFLRHEF